MGLDVLVYIATVLAVVAAFSPAGVAFGGGRFPFGSTAGLSPAVQPLFVPPTGRHLLWHAAGFGVVGLVVRQSLITG